MTYPYSADSSNNIVILSSLYFFLVFRFYIFLDNLSPLQ